MLNSPYLTAFPEIAVLIQTLLERVQTLLGSQLIGMYLEGSLTSADFDQASDIDFVVVTDAAVTDEQFRALQAMHDQIAQLDTPWAIQLEGSYVSQQALRRYDPANAVHPNLERGPGERLKMAQHDDSWLIHLAILHERGIALFGPAPATLIDPVLPDDLRQAMRAVVPRWAAHFFNDPTLLHGRGYQSYTVLSFCRVLYTLQTGTIATKRVAAEWAEQALGPQWAPLIARAWVGRNSPDGPALIDDVSATLALIRYTLEQLDQFADN